MSMVKHKNLSRILVAILAVMTILAFSIPQGVWAADPGGASEGKVGYYHPKQGDVKYVFQWTGDNAAQWLGGVEPDQGKQYVYCINPTRNAMDKESWNQHFRWRYNLNVNRWLLDNNRKQLTNPDIGAGSDSYDKLKAILYLGHPYNGGDDSYDYHQTQDAVEALIAGTSSKQNELYNKAMSYTGEINGNVYFYAPDTDTKQITQNTVGLTLWSQDTPTPEPPKLAPTSVSVGFKAKKTIDGSATEGFDTDASKNQFAFRMYLDGNNMSDSDGNFHTRRLPADAIEGEDPGYLYFGERTFTEPGEYTVALRELLPSDGLEGNGGAMPYETKGMTYDDTVYTFNLKVTKDGEALKITCDGKDVSNDVIDVGTWNNKTKEEPKEGTLKTTVTAGGKTASAAAAVNLTAEEAAKVTSITDKIDYEGLVGGATYSVQGTLMDVTDSSKPTAVATSAAKECTADASGSGSWTIEFNNIQLEAGRTYVVFESATRTTDAKGNEITGGETLKHEDVNDKAQTIVVENDNRTSEKTVKISKKALGGDEIEGAQIVVKKGNTEVEKWTSTKTAHEFTVEPGEYTMTETVAPKGYKQVTTEIKFTVAADGKVTLGTTTVNNGGRIFVQDTNHIILEDAPEGGYIKTTVTAGGKTASANAAVELTAEEAAKVTSITDKIDYEGLVGGATYAVQGRLMDVTDATKPTEVATSAAKECKADASGKGSWTIEFNNIQLEAGRTFVVFESATRTTDAEGNKITGGETLKHEDINDKAQTIIVDEEYESNLSATKTTEVKTATVGDVIPYTISITNDGNGDATDVKVTDYLGKNLKYVSDSNGGNNVGQNVHWTVPTIAPGETVEIEIDCEVSEDAAGKIINKVYIFDSTKPNAEPVEYEDQAEVAFDEPPADDDSNDEGSDGKKKAASPTRVSSLARTSDEFNLGMWAVLMAISAFGLAAAAMRRRYER